MNSNRAKGDSPAGSSQFVAEDTLGAVGERMNADNVGSALVIVVGHQTPFGFSAPGAC
jgi:hypothetical protein